MSNRFDARYHNLFCDCTACRLLWAEQEAYDGAPQGDAETIDYEAEKERDRDLGEPLGADQ
jgi:hypothetical protein